MAQCVVHALKSLACRAPVLLAHAQVTNNILFFNGSKTQVPHGTMIARSNSVRVVAADFYNAVCIVGFMSFAVIFFVIARFLAFVNGRASQRVSPFQRRAS